MNDIQLSIVTVNYQSWELLESYLNSFKQFTPQLSHEIIIVDNFPEDARGASFAQMHPEIQLVSNKGNFGFSHGCNLGANHANGKYLLFLNPDTELTKDNAIDAMVSFSIKHPEVGVVACRTVTPNGGIGRELAFLSPWLLIAWVRQIFKFLNQGNIKKKFPDDADIWYPEWISGAVVLIKVDFFNKIGRWNDKRYWMYHEDPDLCLRVRSHGKKVAILRNVTIKHIEGGISRQSAETTIRSKTEVIISAHNYIQETTNGISRLTLHLLYLLKTLSPVILLLILLPLFWTKKFKIKSGVLIESVKYYISAIFRKTWRSPKLAVFHNKETS